MIVSTLCLGILIPNIPAKASEFPVTTVTRDQIISELTDYGVPEETQTRLLNKLDNGQLWDSLNPEKDSEAIKENLFDSRVKYIYPDGSIKIKIETLSEVSDIPNNGSLIQPFIAKIQYTTKLPDSTSNYNHYSSYIRESVVLYNYSYYVEWSTNAFSSSATILSASLDGVGGIGSVSEINLTQNSSTVRLSFIWSALGYATAYRYSETYVNGRGLSIRGNT